MPKYQMSYMITAGSGYCALKNEFEAGDDEAAKSIAAKRAAKVTNMYGTYQLTEYRELGEFTKDGRPVVQQGAEPQGTIFGTPRELGPEALDRMVENHRRGMIDLV